MELLGLTGMAILKLRLRLLLDFFCGRYKRVMRLREMECASRAPLGDGADEVADNLPASLSVWQVINLVLT